MRIGTHGLQSPVYQDLAEYEYFHEAIAIWPKPKEENSFQG